LRDFIPPDFGKFETTIIGKNINSQSTENNMRMKKLILTTLWIICLSSVSSAQKNATIKEYSKVFPTYPFSDPNPIPLVEKIYPYYRYDGFTDKSVQKEWKVVELENDYIKVMILPEVGGKIWSAIEKGTGKSFIYYNHTVKFRDVAMRGPWTSGGIEPNYGIIGHTPNCATPVDYITTKKEDGSVSCIIGVLDLLTRTPWRMEINLPKDKAYLTTTSFWYNATPLEQSYYTWMNTGIKAKGNLEFIYPGTHYLGHEGEYSDWPINKQNGKDISFYENNNFGGYKSYHVFGKYTDFFGAYWHDEDFGMGRYSTHDDKAGKKIWIWGLSQQGMIWEKLLTDTDGQYVEVQSGRLFNQADVGSTFTPFKHAGFFPYASDTWTEYWFPVKQIKGFVKANNFGALNVKREKDWVKIYFSPLQNINDELKVMNGNKLIYSKSIRLRTMEAFSDSIQAPQSSEPLLVTLGENKLTYNSAPTSDVLERPLETPKDFDWNSVYGLYIQGKENIVQRVYQKAMEKLEACLQKDPYYLPALTDMAMLMLRNTKYADAYTYARKALSINTYDATANYYYGLANIQLGNFTNAKDGFDIASLSIEYRSAAYTELCKIYFRERNYVKALDYAAKSLDFNRYNLDAYQVMAVIHRLQKNKMKAEEILDSILSIDPLNHFTKFEKYLWENSDAAKKQFVSFITNELPHETFMELATWYHQLNQDEDAFQVLRLAPETPEGLYWLAFLKRSSGEGDTYFQKATAASPFLSFPFRAETTPILQWAIQKDKGWKPKYYLGLIYWHLNSLDQARDLFQECGSQPDFAPFYAGRANLLDESKGEQKITDLQHAIQLDKEEWRYHKLLAETYIHQKKYDQALLIVEPFYRGHPNDYIMGMLYAKTLLLNKRYKESDAILTKLNIIPFEGATDGRELYREAKLMQAVQEIGNKNYKKALQFISESKLWPLNLGVGKPYDEDIDMKLEDWMSYLIYEKTGKPDMAKASLQKIVKVPGSYPQATWLVTASAMEKLNQKDEATKWLDQLIQKYPENKILLWCKAMFLNQPADFLSADEKNATIRVLDALSQLH
jgi:predicted Zn-dependent protease